MNTCGFMVAIRPFTDSLFFATPLIMAGLGLAFGFRAGLSGIGGAGQIMFGSLAAIWVAFKLDLPFGLHTLVALVAAAMAGGLYAGIAGFLKARTGANEADRDDHVEPDRHPCGLPTRCPCRHGTALATTTR